MIRLKRILASFRKPENDFYEPVILAKFGDKLSLPLIGGTGTIHKAIQEQEIIKRADGTWQVIGRISHGEFTYFVEKDGYRMDCGTPQWLKSRE